MEYTIEDSYRAKTGHCVVQAANLMAALNLAGVECYRLSGIEPHGHDWLYVPEHDVIISNGNIAEHGKVIWEKSKIFRFISYQEKWARALPYTSYIGTLPPKETVRILEYLSSIHNESFYGGRKFNKKFEKVSFEELIESIEGKEKEWRPLTLD